MTKDTKIDALITAGFAVAHAAMAFTLGMLAVSDELILTLLTMALTVILCLRHNLNIELTAVCVILVNVTGFLIGTEGGILLGKVISNPILTSSIVTFATTMILGLCTSAIVRLSTRGKEHIQSKELTPRQTKILIVAFILIFLLRLLVFTLSSKIENPWSTIEILSMILNNSAVLITSVCINIIFVRFGRRIRESLGTELYWFIFILFLLILSQMCAYIVCLAPDSDIRPDVSAEFIHLCILCIIVNISIYCIIYLVNHSIEVQQQMRIEKEKRHYAQFRYEKLKQHVNPHFLFNSLNVLDSLVLDEQTEAASEFIHKLAGLYRYMIGNEDERLVALGKEMEFVRSYVDLMKTRFPEGFAVEESIADEDMDRKVPPCAVQMQVENAFKHNAVSRSNPLEISIISKDGWLSISNTLNPKKTQGPSTGLGQKYIRQQYRDLGGGEVEIEEADGKYTIRLPLI